MEVKNLFDPAVKQNIVERFNKLTPETKALWGKMNVEQMLAHVQRPIAVGYGTHELKGNFLIKLIGPLFKSYYIIKSLISTGCPQINLTLLLMKRISKTSVRNLLKW
jgi:hypothetical protein